MLPHSQKRITRLLITVLATGMLWFTACENDLENIKKISSMTSGEAIDTTRGVDVIYSDSAMVKGRMITPLLIKYSTAKPYDVMPDGVKVISFNKLGKEEGTIVADSGIQLENENITKFYKNVIVTTADGTTFRSEEMIWDQPKKIVYSNLRVEMHRANGDVTFGTSFISDDKLTNPSIKGATGDYSVPENQMQ
ncbi:LPS export ABC transporter periplasmic protein LptC [Mucilaginibacter calamicampi]|uniref:LPS export ABC transporter periplasmic protein LptC n=1 Tax=Mucilaginibacter calamicampi TaxID=1302352 RepID=A0ABW2YZL6_9SPHI